MQDIEQVVMASIAHNNGLSDEDEARFKEQMGDDYAHLMWWSTTSTKRMR